MVKAILFGSVGTIAETSEIQRASFNEAFRWHDLPWTWQQNEYAQMLERSGGIRRLEEYAREQGVDVDAAAIHKTKFEVFKEKILDLTVSPRPGVADTIGWAKRNGIKLGLVTTTYRNTLEVVVQATQGISLSDFDVITDVASVENRKPAADCYQLAMSELGLSVDDCVAIEDNVDGYTASQLAGLNCFCFPGENTRQHRFPDTAEKIFNAAPAIFKAEMA